MTPGFHVGCGNFGTIFAGTILKNGMWSRTARHDITDECIRAVADHVIITQLGSIDNPQKLSGGYTYQMPNGKSVVLTVEIKDSNDTDSHAKCDH